MVQPIPTPFTDGLNSVLNAAICEVLSNDENTADLLFGSLGNRPTALRNALAAIRANACSEFLEPEDLLPPPFSGGQCPIDYRVTAQVVTFDGSCTANPPSTLSAVYRGPIGGISVSDDGSNANLRCEGAAGNIATIATGLGPRTFFGPNARGISTISITSVVPEPAAPDDCGDISPVPPGFIGGPVTFEGDTTINVDESTQITIPTAIIFAPVYVDLDGSLNFPINVDLGGINFDGTLELFPDFSVELFPNGLNPGAGSSDDGDELADPSPGGPDTPPDNPDDARRIIGVQITAQVPDSAIPTEIAFTNGPAILAPRLGSCRFLVLVNDFSGWTNDIDIKGTETYIPCPVPQGAIAVRCSPAPGVSLQFTPVRGRVRSG